jgi:hypothetical protein
MSISLKFGIVRPFYFYERRNGAQKEKHNMVQYSKRNEQFGQTSIFTIKKFGDRTWTVEMGYLPDGQHFVTQAFHYVDAAARAKLVKSLKKDGYVL